MDCALWALGLMIMDAVPAVSSPGYLREEHGNSADDSLLEGLAAGGILCP